MHRIGPQQACRRKAPISLSTLQEGWRAAVAERARQELASREAAIRADLTKQRDAELEVSPFVTGWLGSNLPFDAGPSPTA